MYFCSVEIFSLTLDRKLLIGKKFIFLIFSVFSADVSELLLPLLCFDFLLIMILVIKFEWGRLSKSARLGEFFVVLKDDFVFFWTKMAFLKEVIFSSF